MTALLSIGELASRTGLPVRTIRFYSDAGVVPDARVTVQVSDHGSVLIVIPGHEQVELPHHMAHAVRVEKV